MKKLAFILLFLCSVSAVAQTQKIAALKHAYHTAQQPAKRFDALMQLLDEHESIFKDTLPLYANEAFVLAKKLNSKAAVINAGITRVNNLFRHDRLDKANRLIDSLMAMVDSSKPNDKALYVQLALQQMNSYAASANYQASTDIVYRTMAIAEHIKDTIAQAKCMNTLAVFAYNMNQLDEGILWCRRVQALCRDDDHFLRVQAYNFINFAMHFAWKEQYDSANHYISKAIIAGNRLQNLYYLANAYLVLCNIHKWNGRLADAQQAMLKAMEARRATEGNITFSNEQLGMANLYVAEKQYNKAIDIYTQGIRYAYDSIKAQGNEFDYTVLLHYYMGLSRSYNAIGDRDKYEASLEHIINLKDTLNQLNSERAMADMQTRYEVQLKDNTIIRQKLDITQKNILFYGSLVVLGLGLIIAWLLFRNYTRRQRMKFYLAQEEEKRKAAWAVKEAEEKERKRIAADLHDNMGSYAASIKANVEELLSQTHTSLPAMDNLSANSQQMVALLGDTIWALKKEELSLSAISDRLKVFLQRLRASHPNIDLSVQENILNDLTLPPAQAYHLFMMAQEAVNNAVRHSGGNEVSITINSDQDWAFIIRDNGKGMDGATVSAEGGNGCYNIRMRAEESGWYVSWLPVEHHGTQVVITNTN